ncbi:transporter [Rhodoplanes elegans]|uniref:Transporter n=1 Tax=Rhodoplanes elegans TaxID=29408 RepID=A0A327KVM1_9BRAD|nr:tripartite tricarboxylate transporter permease [Rhodoplanes elegans]MBK5958851.1 transporter [Rhodoplanes elegans]RAI42126.1 transporter [Rhodoplanes elegans]
MFEGLGHLFAAFETFANFTTLFNVCWATLVGITIGALPGLTATMGVALLTTLTYKMAPEQAILVLISCYVGAIYGGSRSAILLNIPGTPANAATTLDGFPLAKAGRAGEAMGLATTSSMIGTFIGVLFLAIIAPALAEIALDFQSYEYFWLAIFGIVIAGQMCSFDDALKGWIAGFLGLFVAMIGQEGIHAEERFVFGWSELSGGIALIPALVGTFGVAEILTVMRNRAAEMATSVVDHVVPRWKDLWDYRRTVVRSGLIGTAVGIIPGVGEDIGAWISYAAARRASKEKELFGKGSKEGLCAAETGNNAAIPGAIIPALTLAVPGSAPAAVLLAAMLIHGMRPGPMIMIESPDFVFQVVWMVVLATLAMGIFGILLTRPLLKILKVPRERLMPVVFVLCVIGPYAITLRLFDIYVTLFFGILGFVLREMKYPMAPLVLGVILGDILDKSLRRALVLADGDMTPFFTRPISAVLWITTALVILGAIPAVQRGVARLFGWNKA